ncbi:MAG: hypothetical protein WBD79_20720 [Anaerolineae bacterium]
MDVFVLRNRLITDYGDYIKSFINIADTRIAEYVGQEAHQLNLPDAAQHLLFAAERRPISSTLSCRWLSSQMGRRTTSRTWRATMPRWEIACTARA